MPTRFNPPNQAARAKRKEIPEQVWEKHKEVVLQQLRHSGYRKVAKWIEDQNLPEFNPSEVMLRRVKKKWNSTPTDNSTNLQSMDSSAVVEDDDDLLETTEHDCSSVGSWRIAQPHQQPHHGKRPISNDSETSLRVRKRVRDSWELIVEKLSPESDNATPMLTAGSDLTSLETEASPSKSRNSLFANEATYCALEGTDQPEPECPLFEPEPGRVPRLEVGFFNLFSFEFDLSALHHTADVFLASCMESEACRLYILLAKAYQMFRNPPKRKFLLALAGASRCASSPDDIHAVEMAIRNAMLRADDIPLHPPEEWLLQALVVHVHVSLKDYTTALGLIHRYRDGSDDCPQFFLAMADMMKEPEEYYKILLNDIYTAFYFLPSQPDLCSNETVLTLDAWFAKCPPQSRRPENSELRYEKYGFSTWEDHLFPNMFHVNRLRVCIAWVLDQLSSGAGFTLSSRHLRHKFKNPRDIEVATVFFFLWVQWLEENGASGNTMFWVDESTSTGCSGISDVETLKIVSFLIFFESPSNTSTARPPRRFSGAGARALLDKNFEVLQRAIAGTKRLCNESDETLSFKFLQCLTSAVLLPSVAKLKSWLPSSLGTAIADAVLDTDSTALLERSATLPYRIILRSADPSPDRKKKPVAVEAARLQGSKSTSMFAMSLSSSDLSSMRRQQQRTSVLSSISSWRTPSLMDQLSDRFSLMDMAESARNRFSVQSFGQPFLPFSGLEGGEMLLGTTRQRRSGERPGADEP